MCIPVTVTSIDRVSVALHAGQARYCCHVVVPTVNVVIRSVPFQAMAGISPIARHSSLSELELFPSLLACPSICTPHGCLEGVCTLRS